MSAEDNWRAQAFRQSVVSKIEEVIQRSGKQVARNSSEMENHVFMKAKSREDYINMVTKLILHVKELSTPKQNQGQPNMQAHNQNQPGPSPQVLTQQCQPQQGPNNPQGLSSDPINALQNLAFQGSRNQAMTPQAQMQQQVISQNPGMQAMQGQMGQGPNQVSQGPQGQTASNLLHTLNQRPQTNNFQMQKISGPMKMGQTQIGGQMGMGGIGNPTGSQSQNQQGQMMPNMTMQNQMPVPMSGANTMGQMPCNQGGIGGQIAPNSMQGQMGGQIGGMSNNHMVKINMLHLRGAKPEDSMYSGGMTGAARAPPPNQFLRQSPSQYAPSAGMSGPSPVPQGAMPSPMPGMVGGSSSPSAPPHMQQHVPTQRNLGMSMVASPTSSLNTPLSPVGEEVAYREKVRQLSKYIEPLRRMVQRMVSEGGNVEKLTKMKNLLDILSNPNKRMPLETLIKCEVVLEKLDFKSREGGLGPPTTGKEQMMLLDVVKECLTSPLANHTLKRTFRPILDAINGPPIKNVPPPQKIPKIEEPEMEIPHVLQGEIARLDSRFKVSLEPLQLRVGDGGISLVAALADARLPCVPPVHVHVPRGYPATAPARRTSRIQPASPFFERIERAMDARCAGLPKSCSVGQLLDAWEMSVRQACAPTPTSYTPVPALGL